MIQVFKENFNDYKDGDTGECVSKGYGHYEKEFSALYVYIDEDLPQRQQLLTLTHEIIELHFPRVKHSRIDKCVIDLIDAMMQLDFI